jgi:antibiotic biosynthesis monooxygenase (ABM) superfamily enzyme
MATIHASPDTVTQINVFEVDPANQDALAEMLVDAVRMVCTMPGWISASIHKSEDGTRVTNYAQAESHATWQAIRDRLQAAGVFDRVQTIAKANPRLYRCVFTLSAG